MNEFKCSVFNCTKPAIEGCGKCNKTNCSNHSHSTTCPAKQIFEIMADLSVSGKSKYLSLLTSAVSKCASLRSELFKSSRLLIEKILLETQTLSKKLSQLEQTTLSLLSQLQSLQSVQIYQNNIPDQQNLVNFLTLREKHEILEQIDYFKPDFVKVLLKDYQESFINSTPYQHSMSFMAFFPRNSSDLILYHIKDNTIKVGKTSEKMAERAGWCYLPDGRIFYYGGRKEANVGVTCLINPALKTVEFLKKGPELRNIGQLTYYKGEVYAFGGFAKEPSNIASKFSFMKGLWTRLNDMPVASESCCSCFYGNSIIVTGENMQNLFDYDRANGSYRVLIELELGFKVTWSANGRCFLLMKNSIYESGIYSKSNWTAYVDNSVKVNHTRLLAPTAKRGDEIFILFENRQLYSFNLETRRIKFVTEIPQFS